MTMPDTHSDKLLLEWMQGLPDEVIENPKAFGALLRQRAVSSPLALLRLVFLYCGLDLSLRRVAAQHSALETTITEQAIRKRLLSCLPWLREILAHMLPQLANPNPSQRRLLVFDSTVLRSPHSKTPEHKLHVAIDLRNLSILALHLTPATEPDGWHDFPFLEGDVVLADRAYALEKPMKHLHQKKAFFLSRYRLRGVRFLTLDDRPLVLTKELPKDSDTFSMSIVAQDPKTLEKIPLTLHAMRLPQNEADKQKRRLRQRYNRRGQTQSEESCRLCEWMVLVTTLPLEWMSTEDCMALYRARWQIEWAFKRWKSGLRLSELRARRESTLSEVWILGKIIYILHLQRKAYTCWQSLDDKKGIAFGTILWTLLKELDSSSSFILMGRYRLPLLPKVILLKIVAERPRIRRPQHEAAEALVDALCPPISTVVPRFAA